VLWFILLSIDQYDAYFTRLTQKHPFSPKSIWGEFNCSGNPVSPFKITKLLFASPETPVAIQRFFRHERNHQNNWIPLHTLSQHDRHMQPAPGREYLKRT